MKYDRLTSEIKQFIVIGKKVPNWLDTIDYSKDEAMKQAENILSDYVSCRGDRYNYKMHISMILSKDEFLKELKYTRSGRTLLGNIERNRQILRLMRLSKWKN